MEELQDAIEDAQYVNAIASAEDGPRPVLTWEIPTEEQLSEWKAKVHSESKEGSPKPFEFEWTLSHALGFFLFSAFLKEVKNDYVEINFIEEVIRWKLLHGRYRAQKTAYILCNYLTPLPVKVTTTRTTISTTTDSIIPSQESSPEGTVGGDANGNGDDASQNAHCHPNANKCELPPKTEINEVDLAVEPLPFSVEEVEELKANNRDPTYIKNCIGVDGTVLEKVLRAAAKLKSHPMYRQLSSSDLNLVEKYAKIEENKKEGISSDPEEQHRLRGISIISNELPDDLFDEVEAIVLDVIKSKHWEEFLTSPHYEKLINFLWFQDRKVVEEDFFVMRVLGRGGFGLVTACKKGTSGKLYAMKVMNKKRIKIKKAEQLTLNEQKCLADINSPFVVNLKYSFQSSVDVFLILDLMTGGDLSYHLSQKGRFPQNECLYYAARIMLGLQALHDKGYVYRDLKPENCLLGEDGRVKLTDLGLATKVTPSLHGAAGTRGYWAPEMLRRDKNGKRMNYDHMVDWFSFGCCLAEFISGTNPFRSEAALNFGLGRGKKTKEKAIDCATLEMNPEFKREKYSEEAEDICRRLLDKDKDTRLGANGCTEIMKHPWFSEVNWEEIMSDKKQPPFLPPKDVNAASQSEIGTFAEDKTFHETVLDEKDEAVYKDWDFTNTKAFAAEVIEFLIYERETGEPLLPMPNDTSCCCAIL